ncbi:histidine kinase dimerization/phosphoacceptor domain -containing protein [Tumidithrix elongata RA019]|uniref:histidine kinase n=1 Tax=Tumidithrix elongata BACA0141 TaxID=2716417 RepID=A0AAW9PTX5_9CYAN|nr:histidine kinase dimerization/phosphoacceptor domain -containing protein [Tumidithrix elongata RA019]
MELIQEFFTSGGFIPHGHCYLWKTELVWLHLLSDLLIAIAYYSIPISLIYFVRKREDLPFRWIFLLFGVFIILCGTTHVMEIWTLWHPTYWVSGTIKTLTAIVSVFTAASLIPLLPKVLAMPTLSELEAINIALAKEIAERKEVELELSHNLDLREAIYNEATDALFLVDTTTLLIIDCNPCAVEMFEVNSKEELIGIEGQALQKRQFSDRELTAILEDISNKGFWRGDIEYVTKKGKHFWGNLAAKHINVAGQDMNLVRVKNINDRKLAEQEAQEGKRILDALMEYIPDGITIADAPDVNIRRVSKYGEQLTGRSREVLEDIPADRHVQEWGIFRIDGITPATNEELPLTRAVQKGENVIDEEWVLQKPDGSQIVILCNAGPIRDEENAVTGGVIAWRDITDRKRVEEYINNLNIELEARVLERTLELSRANAELETEVNERKRTEERFDLVLKNSPITVFTQDRDLRYTWVYNPALGVDYESVIGKLDAEILTLEEDAQRLSHLKQQVLTNGIGRREEVHVSTHDETRYFDLTVEPLHDRDREIIGIGCVALDITQRKESEVQLRAAYDREIVLMKEIHHRVKNNLQIISGLLYLQSRQVGEPKTQAIIQSSRDRILSMALLHEKLYRSRDLEHIDFIGYIQSLTLSLENSYASRSTNISLNINAEPVKVDIDTAMYCGLIVNELVSNALKYAFPEGRSGQITIEFHKGEPDGYTLIVRDNGIGMNEAIDLKHAKNLGLQLVYSLATQQLKGQISLEHQGGMAFKITFTIKP